MQQRRSPFTVLQRIRANAYWLLSQFYADNVFREKFAAGLAHHERTLLARLTDGYGRRIPVDRVANPDPGRFRSDYASKSRPVVLEGVATEWACTQNWSPEYFADHYSSERSSVTDYGEDEQLELEKLVEEMRQGKLRASHFSKIVHNTPELLKQIDLEYLDRFISKLTKRTSYQFFMGPKGAETALHAGGTNNFHIQIYGEKTWYIIDPIFNPALRMIRTRSPLLCAEYNPKAESYSRELDARINVYEAKLNPGDVLYVPTYFWHHVSYDTDSIAAGVRWFSPLDVWRASLTMFLVMASATNPSVFEYYFDITKGRLNRFYGSKRPDRLER